MALELARAIYEKEEGEYPGVRMSLTSSEFTWQSIMTDEDFHRWEEKMRHIRDGKLPYYIYAEM